MSQKKPAIVAHRGYHVDHPENSMSAFNAAWALPLKWAECDVYVLPDGIAVLHDRTLKRMTELRGYVVRRTAAELRGCRLRRESNGPLTAEKVPLLDAVISGMPAHAALMIEMKGSALIEDFMPPLMRAVNGRTVFFQSFHRPYLDIACRYDPTLPMAYLVETRRALVDAIKSPYRSVHLDQKLLDEKTARQLREAGKWIGVWTVNTKEQLEKIIPFEPEMIITDDPPLIESEINLRQ